MTGEVAISIRNLSKNYAGLAAVDNVSLEVLKGEVFGLIGPNGAGKSTLISVLATLSRPGKGDVFIYGHSVSGQPSKIRKLIGFVPQDIALYPSLTGIDNLKFWGNMYGLRGKLLKGRIEEALSVVGMKDRAGDRIEVYSGGMKRRLNIAVALLHHPDILIMDEPTVGVDILSRKFITDAIRNLKSEGRTIVYTSHYIDEMELICDRIAVMNNGKVLKTGSVEEIRRTCGNLEEAVLQMLMAPAVQQV